MFIAPAGHPVYRITYIRNRGSGGASCNYKPETVANTFSQIYLQFVFAVKGRRSLIASEYNKELHKYITSLVQKPPFTFYPLITTLSFFLTDS